MLASLLIGLMVLGQAVGQDSTPPLTPPYFNLALGQRIMASATCGEDVPEPEIYCKLVGANADKVLDTDNNFIIQGQVCNRCDPSNVESRHPAEYAVDGNESFWMSPPLSRGMKYNEVNLTIDLGQDFHVAYVIVKMANSPRPGVWILERSADFGKTYSPWQYFADNPTECYNYFGSNVSFSITADDTVICDTQFSKIPPLEEGEIVVPLMTNRPSANDFFNSTVLQNWTQATNIRFRFLRVKNLLGHLMSVANRDPTTTRRYFYAIKDISIGGRCRCNGHAETCTSVDQNDPSKLACDCKDNTCGPNCDTCCPGFEQKKWSQSKNNKRFVCEKCNCFGHSDQCVYNETVDALRLSLDIHGNYEGGGVCQNCADNTEGINCDKCVHGYYRPTNKLLNDSNVCQPCQCNFFYSTGNCYDGDGQCECKQEYTKPRCDSCSYGHYGYPVCRQCECFLNGTDSNQCEPDNGRCTCKTNFGGFFCRECAEGYYDFPNCKPCECEDSSSVSGICNNVTGECSCKNSYGGRTCDQCSDGYYNYPSCLYCNCEAKGTLQEVCDKASGQCLCKPGYAGARCDQCVANFTGFPDCKPCNCSSVGSASTICDITGKCTCLPNFAGRLCDQCYPGFYQYPSCLPCICNQLGSVGITCTNDGKCQCKTNFDGVKCEQCKEGFYNYPICEECNFDPAGVQLTFAGCSSLKPGEMVLCKGAVQGKKCDQCEDLHWNLKDSNPEGCEECNCEKSGTVGRIGSCDSKSGQCICKPSATSRQCNQCNDGFYNIQDTNLFGCSDCGCDLGGSVNNVCNKLNGQCLCLPRITGRTCKEPLQAHYFPTLYHYQYEVEDGHTPSQNPVRYGFSDEVFPGYSWKGYTVFSQLQNETVHDIWIDKPSVYRLILRYINRNNQSIAGKIVVKPEEANNIDTEQKFQVLFKPTATPSFVTVAGVSGNIPSPFVLNPGPWTVHIHNERSIFIDYFVLLPSEYYEASSLLSNVTSPCTVDESKLCRHYQYPNVSQYDQIHGQGAFVSDGSSRMSVDIYFEDMKDSFGKLPLLSDSQPELYFDLRISRPGSHILAINYGTGKGQNTTTIEVEATTQDSMNKGELVIYPCRYTTLCRQAVISRSGQVKVFNFTTNFVSVILRGSSGINAGIDSIVAIPEESWSLDYVQPKTSCVRKDNKCVQVTYPSPPDSSRFDFKTGNEDQISKIYPSTIFDNSTELIYLNHSDAMVDASGKVSKPGSYVFVVHYYQPDFPEFDMDVVIHNGQFYEAKLPVKYCPSNVGCRSVVKHNVDGSNKFQLNENFMLTLKEPNHKSIWVHYFLVIPSSLYTDSVIQEQPFDETAEFISQCGQNHFYLNTSEEGFCRDATFSLTTKYNQGGLQCSCNYDGSTSFECALFGGQCPCKENVIGRRCDTCKTGYFGFPQCQPCSCPSTAVCDPFTGGCECPPNVYGDKCNQCRPYTYGYHPIIGCEDCNCNINGVRNGSLQCNLYDGSCECADFVEGRTCDRCIAGHWNHPYCQTCECDLRGTTEEICDQTTSACFCKSNVHGSACDVCKDGTYNLQSDNDVGCTTCFCFGKTTRCSSSTLFTSTVLNLQNWTVANVNVSKPVLIEYLGTPLDITSTNISINNGFILPSTPGVTYFVAPDTYLGNKLTSYDGYFNYTINYRSPQYGSFVESPDVVLYGANIYLLYISAMVPEETVDFPVGLQLKESNFLTVDRTLAKREEILQVLQNLTAILIKASYSNQLDVTTLKDVYMEVATAEYGPDARVALSVELCHCPPNYVGRSCEECADGYFRTSSGPFGGYCVPCQCNGHATTCDKTNGVCSNCKHNTKGDHCEKCEMGYYGNATIGTPTDCLICACPLPVASNNFASGCDIKDEKIMCTCNSEYTGDRCEKCAPGYYGHPEVTGETCVPCNCNGNVNASDPEACDPFTGKCIKCLNNTYGDSCERCVPGYYGDAITLKNCQSCDCDKCGTKECNHENGICVCHENVVGDKCDRCADQHYGYTTCQGCTPCDCNIASDSLQCDDISGHCRCKAGVTGQTCDKCAAGYWQYSSDGCISCGCNTGYSIGVGCNVTTGLCECLPNVVGSKCDTCPYRWVLIPDQGCFECDSCVHALLDVTDEIRTTFGPIYSQFQTTAVGYFTAQRLQYINNTANNLSSSNQDILPSQFDLTPYENNITALEDEAESLFRKINSVYNDATTAVRNGSSLYSEALAAELVVNKVLEKTTMTVNEINALVYALETGTGPKIDYALQEGNNNLDDIESVEVAEEVTTDADETLLKAESTLDNVRNFSAPLNQTIQKVKNLTARVDEFEKKLDDLQNRTESAQKTATEVIGLNLVNKNAKLNDYTTTLTNNVADIETTLRNESNYLYDANINLQLAKRNFNNLAANNTKLKTWENNLNNNVTTITNDLDSIRGSVDSAKNHADVLEGQAKTLESAIKDSVSYDQAVKAATSYKDIVSALDEAKTAVAEANTAADKANVNTNGLPEKVNQSQEQSKSLYESARQSFEDVQQKLAPQLSVALQYHSSVGKSVEATGSLVNDIDGQLTALANGVGKLNSSVLDNIATNNLGNITAESAATLASAKKLYSDQEDTRKSIQQASNFVNRTNGQLPEIQKVISDLKPKINDSENTYKKIDDSLEELRQKILLTRDIAAKIKVGVTMFRNSSLELPLPMSMTGPGSSTDISLFFKTDKQNGILFYIGNEAASKRKRQTDAQTSGRPKLVDFLALEIENGYALLTVDLGEKSPVSVAVVDKYVADNHWYNAIIKRVGKLFMLTIVQDMKDKDPVRYSANSSTSGLSSVFNVDEHSRFFVGGIPSSFDAPSAVKYPTFDGRIEELVVDNIAIGLWNFVDLATFTPDVPKSTAINGSVERDELLVKITSNGCRFNGNGYVALSQAGHKLGEESYILMNFKTSSLDGLLFLAFMNDTFFSIELKDGQVLFQYNVGSGLVSLPSPGKYNDDQWHTIEATQYKNSGVLKVDGASVKNYQSDAAGALIASGRLYVGGYETMDHKLSEVTNTPFDGCIDNVQISGTSVNLNTNEAARGIIAGCPSKSASFVSFEKDTGGYVRWPTTQPAGVAKSGVELTMRIRPNSTNALITYGLSGATPFYLLLSEGNVVFKSGGQSVTTSSAVKFNDGQWHTIMASHGESKLQLVINDEETFLSSGTPSTLDAASITLYFGTVPSAIDAAAAYETPYAGCVGDATVNGVVVNFGEVAEANNATLGACAGRTQRIKLSTYGRGTEPPIQGEITTPSTAVTTLAQSITVALGCLPVYPAPDPDITPESGYRFGTTANGALTYVFDRTNLEGKMEVSIDLKTIHKDGIIFYVTEPNQNDFVTLYLKDMKLYFSFRCGTNNGTLTSNTIINNGEFHNVVFGVDQNKGMLDVSTTEKQVTSVGCKPIQLSSPFYIGGMDSTTLNSAASHLQNMNKSFIGCIKNFKLNDVAIGEPSSSNGVIPCSSNVEVGTFFSADGGYIKTIGKFKVQRSIEISMDIRTRRLNGLLMAVHGKKHYVLLQMIDGSIKFSVDSGSGPTSSQYTPPINTYFCDGEWHNIRALIRKNVITLVVDQTPNLGYDAGTPISINDYMYVGGYPAEKFGKLKGVETKEQYVGCIKSFQVNQQEEDLSRFAAFGNVSLNVCPTI